MRGELTSQIDATRSELSAQISVVQATVRRMMIAIVAGLFGIVTVLLVKGG